MIVWVDFLDESIIELISNKFFVKYVLVGENKN